MGSPRPELLQPDVPEHSRLKMERPKEAWCQDGVPGGARFLRWVGVASLAVVSSETTIPIQYDRPYDADWVLETAVESEGKLTVATSCPRR